MPDKEGQPFVPVDEIEDWEDDVMFAAKQDRGKQTNASDPMAAVMAEEFAGFVPEDNPGKIFIEDEAEMNDYVRVRAFIAMFPEIPDRTRKALLEAVENREEYSNSIKGAFRKELSEIFRSFGGESRGLVDEASGVVGFLKDDMSNDDE